MLSGLTFGSKKDLEKQFQDETAQEQLRKREEKKLSKHKKRKSRKESKKHKKEKHKHDSSSESEPSSGPEDAWLQQQQAHPGSPSAGGADADVPPAPSLTREDWMTVPMARSLAPQLDKQPEKAEQPEEAPVVAGIRYMKPEQAAAAAAREEARRQAADAAASRGTTSGPAAGAASVSWRVKALQRAQQLAKEQGRELNEVLSERWGSAAEIAKGIMDNAATVATPSHGSDRHRQADHQRNNGSAAPYLSGVRSERSSMMKPPALSSASGGSKLSWRRPAADGGSREHERHRPHDVSTHNHRDRAAGWDPEDRQQHTERGSRESCQDRRGSEGSRQQDRQHESVRQQGREHERDRYADRGQDRDNKCSSDRGSGRHGRDNRDNLSRDSQGAAGRNGRSHSRDSSRQQQPQREVVEALKAVAGSINTYSNDGSFLQQFQQHTQLQPGPQQQSDLQARDTSPPPRQQQQLGLSGSSRDCAREGKAAAAVASEVSQGAVDPGSAADLHQGQAGGRAAAAGMGNRSAADALRARLGGKARPPAAAAAAESGSQEVVHLPLVDAAGRAAPGAFGRETAAGTQRALEAAAGGRVAKRVQRYNADGTRERYFADDDSTDLQTLVKRAKHGDDAADIDRVMMSNIAKRARFKEADLDPDAEYDFDAGVDLSDSRRRKGDVQQQAARERQRQVAQFNRMQRLEDKCSLCFKSTARNEDLTIAVGQSSYLSLVPRGKLVDGHCSIITQEHTPSMRQVDDDTWNEVRNWQKCLISMFLAQGKQVIFLETAMAVGTHRHHALMEAVPVDDTVISKAPMYFKKAMEEAESEWSQHAAKAAISTRDKGLRGSIPPNFPYLYVQFGPSNGYVHVIDDEQKFDRNLGRQVLVGLLKLPAEAMHRRAAALDTNTVKREAAAFRKQFSPFF